MEYASSTWATTESCCGLAITSHPVSTCSEFEFGSRLEGLKPAYCRGSYTAKNVAAVARLLVEDLHDLAGARLDDIGAVANHGVAVGHRRVFDLVNFNGVWNGRADVQLDAGQID